MWVVRTKINDFAKPVVLEVALFCRLAACDLRCDGSDYLT